MYPALQVSNQAPQAVDASTKADFLQLVQNMPYSYWFSNRAVADIQIDLPPVLQFDTAAGPLVYITQGASTYYPSGHPSSNVWRFKTGSIPGYNAQLHVKLKGYCDPNYCSGIVNWGYQWRVNPDTTSCSNFNTFGCVSYPISWTSNCKVCCDSGLVNLVYTTNRKSYGRPDNNDDLAPDVSGTIDTTKIRTNYVLYGDTVEYYQKSYVLQGQNPWSSLVGEFNVPNNTAWWDVLSNSVTIKRAAGGTASASATADWSGNNLRFNYSSLGPFYNNDTVIFRVRLRLKANTQTTLVTQNAAYVSHINNLNQSGATRFSCGPIIDGLSLWYHTQFLDRVQDMTSSGCGQIVERNYYYVAEGAYGYAGINRFPYEYRANAYPTKTMFKYPEGWVVDSVALINNSGSNFPSSYSNLNVPFTFVNDTLKYDLSPYFTPNGGLMIPTDEGGTVTVFHYLKPTCKATPSISYVVTAQNAYNAFQILNQSYPLYSSQYNTQTTIRNVQPQFLVNSSTPVATAYTKNVSWPLTYTNVTSVNSVNNWIYLTNASGTVQIDSVKEGSVLISPDANGFYRLGAINANITRSLRIHARSTACNKDSIIVDWGYGCTGYPLSTSNLCNYPPSKLYVQPSPAAIQTTITSLSATPNDPANPSGATYGNAKVWMCSSFPMEFHILSTEPGTIYNVKENIFLPVSGLNVGLDYISDSGYIEYPVGTAPRKFSAAANTALLAQVSSGIMSFDLAQIDPTNFSTNSGLYGTGTAPNNDYRKAILRFKFRTNCNLVSGAQWQAVQQAISPCGNKAGGNNGVTSGFPLDINGVTPVPYVATINVVPSLVGCSGDTATFKIIKIGSSAVSAGDSIRVYIPNELSISGFRCSGSACPGATPSFQLNPAIGGKEYAIRIPSAMGNLDSVVFKTKINTPEPNGCNTSLRVSADVTRQLTIYCPTIGANCPNAKQSLGSSTSFISTNKPDLSLTAFSGRHMAGTTYELGATISNAPSGATVNSGTSTIITYFWDVNNNNAYDAGTDKLVGSKTLLSAISPGGFVSWNDTVIDNAGIFPPSPTLRMIAMIDATAGPNCNCSSQAVSPFLVSLPLHLTRFTATKQSDNSVKVHWSVAQETDVNHYEIERKITGETQFKSVGTVPSSGLNNAAYNFTDPSSELFKDVVYYRIKSVSYNGSHEYSNIRSVVFRDHATANNSFAFWPNPAQTLLNISVAAEVGFSYNISNTTGQVLLKGTCNRSFCTADVSGLGNGLYILTVTDSLTGRGEKLVISR